MRPRRRIYLPIDPDRPLGWVLLELVVCIGRLGSVWFRRHPRTAAGLVAAAMTALWEPTVANSLLEVLHLLQGLR